MSHMYKIMNYYYLNSLQDEVHYTETVVCKGPFRGGGGGEGSEPQAVKHYTKTS